MSDFYCDQVLQGKINVEVVVETDLVLAFQHTQPYFERHVVVISKQHIASISADEVVNPQLALEFMTVLHRVSSMLEKEYGGCRICSNVGSYQTTKHLHWYVHAGKRIRDEMGAVIKA